MVGASLLGKPPEDGKKEDKGTDWEKEAKTAEDKFRYTQTMKSLSGADETEKMRLERETEAKAERDAAAARAQELENDRLQRIDDERKTALQKAEDERKAREEREKELAAEKQRTVSEQISALKDEVVKMREGGGDGRTLTGIASQIKDLKTAITDLGLVNPAAARDASTEVELARLSYQQAKEDREFQWKMRQDDKNFKIELKKLDRDWDLKLRELDQANKKDSMIANMPAFFGAAVAKGLVDNAMGTEMEEGGDEAGERITRQPKPKSPPQNYHLEVPEGEAGETICPKCKNVISIRANTKQAVCLNCQSRFPIVRLPREPQQEPPAPEPETNLETTTLEEEEE